MTGAEADGRGRRSGSGCAAFLGAALILFGGLALWINLAGAQLARLVFDLLPLAAVWWPLILVLWGLVKLWTRFRTGSAQLRFWEVALLVLVILFGTALSLGRRFLEGQDLHFRYQELSRWAEEQAAPVPQHAFVTERVIPLPSEGPVEISLTLPTGGILVEAVEPPVAADPGEEAAAAPAGGSGRREARLTLTKRVWASSPEEAASRAGAAELTVSPPNPGEEQARIEVEVEDTGFSDIAFDLIAALPAGVRVAAASGGGPVRARGAFVSVTARTSGAPLEVEGAAGAVSLSARDGSIRASDLGGSLRIRGRRTVIEAEAVAGPVSVESAGAPIWIADAGGSVRVTGDDAPVTISDARGPVEVEARIAAVTLRRIAGEARIRSEYGPVLAVGVAGLVDIGAGRATVEVRESGGPVDIRETDGGAGGRLLLEEIAGPVRVVSGRAAVFARALADRARFIVEGGEITIRDFSGPLTVEAGEAQLDVAASALGGEVSLATDTGDVRFGLPASLSFALRAELGEGEIESEFELERMDGDGGSHWVGSRGSGSPPVTITTGTGDVRLLDLSRDPPAGQR